MGTRIDHGPEQRPGSVAELSRYSLFCYCLSFVIVTV